MYGAVIPMLRSCSVRNAPMSERFLVDQDAAELGQVGAQCQAVDGVDPALLLELGERLSGELFEILVACGDADVVETVVGTERVGAIERMTGHAASAAVEHHPALLGLR